MPENFSGKSPTRITKAKQRWCCALDEVNDDDEQQIHQRSGTRWHHAHLELGVLARHRRPAVLPPAAAACFGQRVEGLIGR